MSVFRFVLLALACFRITRFFTTDRITEPIRNYVIRRQGEDSNSAYFVSCNWCVGVYITAAIFAIDYFFTIPFIILAAVAAMAIVGFIGNYDDE